jgi:putative membrane protein insertion efficiency factor
MTRQRRPTSGARRPVLAAIRWYQRNISTGLTASCRFQPTCSHYTYEAVEAYGVSRGVLMGVWRLLRCNPLNDGGFDPVAEPHARTKGSQKA